MSSIRKVGEHRRLSLRALPIAIRLDITLPVGERGEVAASMLYWISPNGDDRPKKALEVLLLSN